MSEGVPTLIPPVIPHSHELCDGCMESVGYEEALRAALTEAERARDEALWSCPECAFTFDACHTDVPDGGYSCPQCENVALRTRINELETVLRNCAVVAEDARRTKSRGPLTIAARQIEGEARAALAAGVSTPEPTPETCPTCGSNDRAVFYPPCRHLDHRHPWHSPVSPEVTE